MAKNCSVAAETLSFFLSLAQDYLDKLPPKDAFILKYRYGLDTGKVRTLEETGKMLEVSKQRVYQLEERALKELVQVISAELEK